MKKYLAFAVLLIAIRCAAQVGPQVGNPIDRAPALPATCSVGQGLFFKTSAADGLGNVSIYACLVKNTWTDIRTAEAGGTIPNTPDVLKGDNAGNAASTGVTNPSTGVLVGLFEDQGGSVFAATAYASLQAAVTAACTAGNGNVVDMGGIFSPLTLSSLSLSCPVKIQNCHTTITLNGADPGQSSGAILITSNGVSIEGIVGNNQQCILTRANSSGIQNLIYSGTQSHLSMQWLTYDGNETNQTYTNNSTTYYTGWHTSALGGGTDLTFSHNYYTRGGARTLDWRGVTNTHADDNTGVDNGINIGGSQQSRGNSFSIDIGDNAGTIVPSTDNWCENNYDTCHGDSFRCGNLRAHVLNNHIYGCVTEGKTPWFTETGIDAYGLIDSNISGNYVTDTFNNAVSLEDYLILGTEYTPARDTLVGNDIVCDTSVNVVPYGSAGAKATCMLEIGNAGNGTTLSEISLLGNHITGAPFVLDDIAGLIQIGNTHDGNVVNTYTATPALEFISGVNMTDFVISSDTFDNTTSYAVGINNSVTNPGPCKVLSNNFTANVTTKISYGTGGAATICDSLTSLTVNNQSDANLFATFSSGVSSQHITGFYLQDRGTNAWAVDKGATGNFEVIDSINSFTRQAYVPGGFNVWYAPSGQGHAWYVNGSEKMYLTATAVNGLGVTLGNTTNPFTGATFGNGTGTTAWDLTSLTGARSVKFPDGNSTTVMPASLVTTAAASDAVAITGVTSGSHCSLAPTNALAATNVATTYISAKTTGSITVTHSVTASMNYDILCTVN